MNFTDAISAVRRGENLDAPQASALIDAMLCGQASEDEIGSLLLALRDKGETVDELVGAAQAMRRHMTRIEHYHDILLDTCGTGGSGSGTFNISTAIAIVTAACGVAVAKHGNRAATSKTGSADVLERLGVELQSDPASVSARLQDVGLCFCFAPMLHPAMKHVVGVRRKLGVKTLFNLLGPLCNPAGATHQLLGTATSTDQNMVAAAMARLDTTRSFVIHSDDGQDEVSLCAATTLVDVRDRVSETMRLTAEDFGLPTIQPERLAAADPSQSARIIQSILAGDPGPCRDTVVAGTAAALMLVGKSNTPTEGVAAAQTAIDDGVAADVLDRLSR